MVGGRIGCALTIMALGPTGLVLAPPRVVEDVEQVGSISDLTRRVAPAVHRPQHDGRGTFPIQNRDHCHMPLPSPLLMNRLPLPSLHCIPAGAWVALALLVGSAPWVATALELFWPDLLF